MAKSSALREAISECRRWLGRIEQLTAKDSRHLPQIVLDAVSDCGPLSTAGVLRICGRRRGDVIATLKILQDAKQIRRVDGKWEVVDGE